RGTLKALAASAVMAAVILLARRYLFGDLAAAALSGRPVGFLPLAGEAATLAVIGAAAYAAVLWWFRVEEWAVARDIMARAWRRLYRVAAAGAREP
ncbi:MAG TPA: murein biosynthesis integral membrane protein MurJ, partial [Thermaerobacter sp.]